MPDEYSLKLSNMASYVLSLLPAVPFVLVSNMSALRNMVSSDTTIRSGLSVVLSSNLFLFFVIFLISYLYSMMFRHFILDDRTNINILLFILISNLFIVFSSGIFFILIATAIIEPYIRDRFPDWLLRSILTIPVLFMITLAIITYNI